MDKKLLFIVNPRAGKTKSHAPLFDAVSIYSEAGFLVSVRVTSHAARQRSLPKTSARSLTSSSATAATGRSTKR